MHPLASTARYLIFKMRVMTKERRKADPAGIILVEPIYRFGLFVHAAVQLGIVGPLLD